ncbi:tetratricopeptide (TPR) repeat protein [Saccharothrix ecbatanensis]|uniref:Tetratricopeptide (TPR) repeat protein n=1 Tax=Saccharothrix ecbatanensis TaxID=1105145 RepID=A0A7W9M0M0_9PSEU|nr:tetratricopeptide repeat protein [Saccharothrix ecbatanensis]MBB5803006.1 tetratricopeptide (TPR) repeat protein [Saccharothrix ecbatanensis]
MARTVRHVHALIGLPALVLAGALALFSAPQVTASQEQPSGQVVTATLPAGVTIPGGNYRGTIVGPNGPVNVTFAVAGGNAPTSAGQNTSARQDTSAPPATSAPSPADEASKVDTTEDTGLPTVLLTILATVLLIGLGLLVVRKILVPRKHNQALRAATALVAAGDYAAAVPALTGLENKLTDKQRARARFFAAFALFRMDDLDEAEHQLGVLNREDPKNPEVAYLLAHLRTERRDYDGAEPVLSAIEGTSGFTPRFRKLLGVIKFRRALEALRDGRVDVASALFAAVETLGDFRDLIPADLRNQHITLGAQALYDRDVVAARKHFEDLEQAALAAEPADREQMNASAELGLALAAWIEDRPDSGSHVDALLTSVARRLDPDGPTELPWPDDALTASVADRLAAMHEGGGEPSALDRTLRDVHLLRAAALLRRWAADPKAAAKVDARLAEVLGRLGAARERDPEFSDTYLTAGLLRYYLAGSDAAREEAAAILQHAQLLGVRDPEVLGILNREARRSRANRDAVDAYLQVLDRYVEDGSVREQVRADLVRRLSRYRKVRDWDSRPEIVQVRVVAPTVAEMNDRSELLRERVGQLLSATGGDLAGARDLVLRLEADSRQLSEQARSVEQKEADLLVLLGDRLLGDYDDS